MIEQTAAEMECVDVTIPMPWGHLAGRWYGNRNVRPILALHGWLDNIGTWNTLIPLMPPHIGVLCIDLPGHGLSSKLPNGVVYHALHYISVILKIMHAYDWPKVSIMAHSMSSVLTFIFTAIYTEKVDMVITLDVLKIRYFPPDIHIRLLRENCEKFLVEDDRLIDRPVSEPPSYTYEQLEERLYQGTTQSVALENCKHILERNTKKSTLYPDKYYFTRDGRVKHYTEFLATLDFTTELSQRIRNVPYCVIKATNSRYINEQSAEIIEILRANNAHFQLHEVAGTHHVHLNNPAIVAAIINPFISRHRPPLLHSWTIDEEDTGERGAGKMKSKMKAQRNSGTKERSKL